ncbi:DUF7606 domain-containing protein [Ottowia testudinis]|uniref:ACP-like domain-containing protein n=1 Tax=Ottowia testudinis TaxID=2816950 RepID=A0A975CGV5_9BURK|nr:hypothetical protein [Ottowia testudinis]QTD46208.1 hypothetical protein J1M35_04695 [Ottowia testudinis]
MSAVYTRRAAQCLLACGLAAAGTAQAQVVSYNCAQERKVVVQYLADGGDPHARVTLEGRTRRLTLDKARSNKQAQVYKGSSYTLTRSQTGGGGHGVMIAKDTPGTASDPSTPASMALFKDCQVRKPG